MKKIAIAIIFIGIISAVLYIVLSYQKTSKNDLKSFSDLSTEITAATQSSTAATTLRGAIGFSKEFEGKVYIGSIGLEIENNSYNYGRINPGYYSVSIQGNDGKYYQANPSMIQIFPGANNIKISAID